MSTEFISVGSLWHVMTLFSQIEAPLFGTIFSAKILAQTSSWVTRYSARASHARIYLLACYERPGDEATQLSSCADAEEHACWNSRETRLLSLCLCWWWGARPLRLSHTILLVCYERLGDNGLCRLRPVSYARLYRFKYIIYILNAIERGILILSYDI